MEREKVCQQSEGPEYYPGRLRLSRRKGNTGLHRALEISVPIGHGYCRPCQSGGVMHSVCREFFRCDPFRAPA